LYVLHIEIVARRGEARLALSLLKNKPSLAVAVMNMVLAWNDSKILQISTLDLAFCSLSQIAQDLVSVVGKPPSILS
jgi:hypothetical protein